MDEIEWNNPEVTPDLRTGFESGLSEDVLVFCKKSGDHTIGWYNYNNHEWVFLCREVNFKKFKWRRLTDKYDRYE